MEKKKHEKTVLISIDGMRPDGLRLCGNPYLETLKKIFVHLPGKDVFSVGNIAVSHVDVSQRTARKTRHIDEYISH